MSACPAPTLPFLVVISGPAGSGKTTLCTRLLQEFPDAVRRLVTTTSRDPRPGERDGVDYHFIPADAFEAKIRAGEFIEWAKVHGRYYGSQRRHMRDLLASGCDILLNIDVQGAQAFRREERDNPDLAGRVKCVFIKPQSMDQIARRLAGRGADDEQEIARRLRTAEAEIRAADGFDHVIVSDTREADYAALRAWYTGLRAPAEGPAAAGRHP